MLTIKRFASIPGGADLTALYRARVGDYPKFFKMDTACKLGFLLAEQLADEPRFTPREDRAVLMFSTCGSLCNDRHYEETVREFPSPSLFVYTLPNIITGEIAIRNKYEGETSASRAKSPSGTSTRGRPRPMCWSASTPKPSSPSWNRRSRTR